MRGPRGRPRGPRARELGRAGRRGSASGVGFRGKEAGGEEAGKGGGRDGSRNRLGRVRIVLTSRRPQGDLSGQARGHAAPPNLGAPLGRGGAHAWPRRRRREDSVSALQPSPRPGAVSGHRRALEGAARLRGRDRDAEGSAWSAGRARREKPSSLAAPSARSAPRGRCAVAVTAACGGRARCRPAGRARGADVCRAGGKPWGGWRPASWPPLGAVCGAVRRQHGPSR